MKRRPLRSRQADARSAGSSAPPPAAALRRRRFPALAATLLGAVLLGGGLWAGLRSRPDRIAASPVWEQTESAEEARLLAAAQSRPTDGAAHVALGRHYLAEGRPFEAAWSFQAAQERTSGSQQIELTLALAEALEVGGLPLRALALLDEAAAQGPAEPSLAVRRAGLHLRLGRPEAALAALQPLEKGASTASVLLRARLLEAVGDDAAALSLYQRCVRDPAHAAEAHLRRGRLLIRLGRAAEGRTALEAASRLSPDDPEPPYVLGMSFLPQAGAHPEQAGRWFSQALQVAPTHGPSHVALGRLAANRRLWKVAAEQFEQALRAEPRDADARLGLADMLETTGYPADARRQRGLACLARGQLPQALREFRAMKAATPESREAALLISQALIQMERSTEAAREIQAAAARFPTDASLKQRLAQLYIDGLSRGTARRLCEEWHRGDPRAAKPLWLLGRIALLSAHERPRAVDYFAQARRLDPADAEVAFALGEALARPGPRRDLVRALDHLAQAVALDPRDGRYRYHLAHLLQQSGHLEAARRQYLRALDLDPGMTAAAAGLIQVAGKLGASGQVALLAPIVREQQAAKAEEARLRARTYRASAGASDYAALARYLMERGRLPEARAQWEVVLTLRPADEEARQALLRLVRVQTVS
jgi:tetratricopeptide (TPR) repeat protein